MFVLVAILGGSFAENEDMIKNFVAKLENIVKVNEAQALMIVEQAEVNAEQNELIRDLRSILESNNFTFGGQIPNKETGMNTTLIATIEANEKNFNTLNTTVLQQIELMQTLMIEMKAVNETVEEQAEKIESNSDKMTKLNSTLQGQEATVESSMAKLRDLNMTLEQTHDATEEYSRKMDELNQTLLEHIQEIENTNNRQDQDIQTLNTTEGG